MHSPPLLLAALFVALLSSGPAPADAPAKGEVAWKPLFDGKSLAGWKETDFFGKGKVHVAGGAIVMEQGKRMTGVTYARDDFPKLDYEVTLEAKKGAGDDFFATTTFPVGDTHCSLVLGGWGGKVVGLSSVDSEDASVNETRKDREFARDRWYRLRIRVTKARIQAWIDADRVIDLDTTDRRLSVRIECLPSRPFGISTWKTTGAVRDVRVRLLTDAEKKAAKKEGAGRGP